MRSKIKCYECGYNGINPANAHIRCKFNWSKSELVPPKGNLHGIKNGWYIFPLNFDPVWMDEECKAFSMEINKEMVKEKYDPLLEVAAILGGVGR